MYVEFVAMVVLCGGDNATYLYAMENPSGALVWDSMYYHFGAWWSERDFIEIEVSIEAGMGC